MKTSFSTLLLGLVLSTSAMAQTVIVDKNRTVTTIYPPTFPVCGTPQATQAQKPFPNITVYPPPTCVPANVNSAVNNTTVNNVNGYNPYNAYNPYGQQGYSPYIPGQIYPTPQPMTPAEALGYSLGVAVGIRH